MKNIEKIPNHGVKFGVIDFNIESIVTNQQYFNSFQEYLSKAYSYCNKTNSFSVFSFQNINNPLDRTVFHNFIQYIEAGNHEKILSEAVEKECKTFLRVGLHKYKEIDAKFNNGSEPLNTIEGNEIRFGFSSDTPKMITMASLVMRNNKEAINKLFFHAENKPLNKVTI